jgi:hypothetical protein
MGTNRHVGCNNEERRGVTWVTQAATLYLNPAEEGNIQKQRGGCSTASSGVKQLIEGMHQFWGVGGVWNG